MNFEFPEEIIRVTFSKDKVFECEVGEAWHTVGEFMEASNTDREYLGKLQSWVQDKAKCEITLGQAEQLDRAIGQGYEEFKKKLPALPKSLSSTESSPAQSPSSLDSARIFPGFEQETNLPSDNPGESSHPNELSDSSSMPPRT